MFNFTRERSGATPTTTVRSEDKDRITTQNTPRRRVGVFDRALLADRAIHKATHQRKDNEHTPRRSRLRRNS